MSEKNEKKWKTRPTSLCFFDAKKRVILPKLSEFGEDQCISAAVPGKP